MSRFAKSVSAAAVAAILGLGASAHAASVMKSGDVVDGWKVSFPVGISLFNDGGSAMTIEKQAAFDSNEGLDITFTQVCYSASPTITLADESLTNVSGTTWSGFQFLLGNTLDGNAADAVFPKQAGFNLAEAGSIFTGQTIAPYEVDYSGVMNNYDTAKLGFGVDGGQIVMDADPAASGLKKVFDFKEIPAAVPLPAASWMGLSGLVGLGLIAHGKKIAKILA